MTGTNTKVRSIFLTVLMVLSVFAGTVAFAGSAAAGNNISASVSPSTAGTAGAEYTHSYSYGGPGDIQYVDVEFGGSNPDLGSVTESDISVYVDGTEYQDGYSSLSTSSNMLEFTLSNSVDGVDSGTNVTVVIGDVVNGDAGTYDLTTTVSDSNDENPDSGVGSYTIDPSGDGGTDTGDQDPPYEPVEDFDATFETGANRWTGQTLLVSVEFDENSDNVAELHEVEEETGSVGQLVTEISYDSDTDEALVSTSGLEGEYVLTDGNGNILTASENGNATDSGQDVGATVNNGNIVNIVPQDFSASFADNTVVQGESVSVDFESNRGGGYYVTVTSEGLSDSEIEDTFGDAQSARDGAQVLVSGNDVSQSYDLPSDVSTGNFTVDFEVADTGESDSDYLDIGSSDRQASFSQAVYSEERGDVAAFTVDLEQSSTADVRVGGADVNYNVTLTVTDNDDDGEVTVLWNTWEAGRYADEGRAFSADGDEDSVSQVRRFSNRIPTDARVSAADYDLTVSVQGNEEDVAVIDLGQRSTDSAQQWVANGNANTYENSTELLDAVTEGDETASGDLAVTQVQASGIFAYVTGAADLEDSSDDGVSVTIEQAGDTINQNPKEVSLDQSGVNLYFDADNNQHFVVVDTDAATAKRGTQSGLSLEEGETYNVTFTIDGDDSPYVADGETEEVTSQFTIVEPTAEFDTAADGNVTVESASEQTITGTTNVAPGTSITVRARSTGDSPFLKSNTTTVADDGTFTSTFDFQNVSQDTQFTVTIPNPNRFEDDASTPGVVAPAPTASVTINDQSSDGSTVTVASASLSDGGFVTIHDGSLLDGDTFESVRGTSAYLEAGEHSDITVSLDTPYEEDGTAIAMPHLDTNGNEAYDFVSSDGAEDGPYTDSQGNITLDSASLTISTPTPEPSPTPTPESTPTPTDEPTPTPEEPTPSPTPTDGGGPGFGLAAALIALAGAALLALRRD